MSFLSKEKFKELQIEINDLKNNGRKEISERLDSAKALGDLSENAEYHQAREDQGKMEARLFKIEHIVKTAEIVQQHHSDVVEIGTIIEISTIEGKIKTEYEITGKEDSDIMAGKIDFSAPLAKAMMGKKEGESFNLKKPNGEILNYKIVTIK